MNKRSNWWGSKMLAALVVGLLIALVVGCAQPAPTPTPTATQPAKAAPTKEAKPETKAATPQAKEAKPQATQAAKAEQKLTKIKVAYAAISGVHAPLWITKERGLFEKYGLDVSLEYIATSGVLTAALIAGEVPMAGQSGGAMISAALGGADVVIVAGIINAIGQYLYSQPSIQRIEDLRGKTVGVTRFGATTDFSARYTLKKFGLEPDKDVSVVQTGGLPESLAALQAGGIQATVFGPPNSTAAKKAGMRELFNIGDLAIPYHMGTIATSKRFLANNEDTARSFLKAIVEGIATAKKDKEFAMKVIGQYTKSNDREVQEDTYSMFIDKLAPRVPYATSEGIQTILDEIARDNPKAKDAKPEVFYDNRLVKELDDSGFIKKLYGE
ncbi:MAG: ABC transporter substrate-binding protein [Chloroflexi bacterium]|nr:ABC transporter substrate-binding protein [Chloroflexota bacterium]